MKQINKGENVNFVVNKQLRYLRKLGEGGTGETLLFKDETTDFFFAIKKFKPIPKNDTDEAFSRFVDEVKILYRLSHPNLVRIFNYYLYPGLRTGYIQMEYIDGVPLDQVTDANLWLCEWEDIFKQTIDAFAYLEKNHILHRDIRANNILFADECEIKVIDFGFGKLLNPDNCNENSVYLNWPVDRMPKELVEDDIYDNRTEIFFVGELFNHLHLPDDFKFFKIIDKMTELDPEKRYDSFETIIKDLTQIDMFENMFTSEERTLYQSFMDDLVKSLSCFIESNLTFYSIEKIQNNLYDLLESQSLEKYIQRNNLLINCFVSNQYRYFNKPFIYVNKVKDFYNFFVSSSADKKKMIIENISIRLDKVPIEEDDDFIPF